MDAGCGGVHQEVTGATQGRALEGDRNKKRGWQLTVQLGLVGNTYEAPLALSSMVMGTLQRVRGLTRQEGRSQSNRKNHSAVIHIPRSNSAPLNQISH